MKDAVPHTFIAESRELLREMESALLKLEQSPRDAEAINSVFRAVHTIKGSSGMFGFDAIVEFTHVMEGVMVDVRQGRVDVDDTLVALLLTCGDHVSAMIDCLETDDPIARLMDVDTASPELLAQLSCCSPSADAAASSAGADIDDEEVLDGDVLHADAVANPAWHISVRFSQEVLKHGMDPLSFLRYLSTLGDVASVVTLLDAMPDAEEMDPEACYLGLEIRFVGDVERSEIESAFEYVREDSTIGIMAPHASLSEYMNYIEALPEDTERLGEILVSCGALTRGELEKGLQRNAEAPSVAAAAAGTRAAEVAGAQEPSLERKANEHRFIRVDAAKLDDLINLVGELVISSAGVGVSARRAGDMELLEAAANLSRLVEEVRDGALTLRMVPIGETFSRFHRVVHDLGRSLGKDVELVISGAETELDKSMVEKLNDPLMHLVRNAMDHGIEPPGLRLLRGKPARGKLTLHSYHETGNIVIKVADDGAGLDRDKILSRARENGLIATDQTLTDHEIYQLVMEPGFSTADEVTNISGRGIGMDVVKRNIEALRGSVNIESIPHQGTVTSLRVPLTLAIIDGFLVGVGGSSYVVPLEMVVECLELAADERTRVRERGYLNLRGEVLPLLRLRDVFEVQAETSKRENIVVVQYAGQRAGFVVDALLGEFQTVIKPLGKLFERLAGISGSTILGTGDVALILDVQALVEQAVRAEVARNASLSGHALAGAPDGQA